MQGEILQKRGLSCPWIAQDDESIALFQQVQHGHRFAHATANGFDLRIAHLATCDFQFSGPRLSFRQLDPCLEWDIHVRQGQAKRDTIRDAHPPEIQIMVSIDQVRQILLCRPA